MKQLSAFQGVMAWATVADRYAASRGHRDRRHVLRSNAIGRNSPTLP